jgi:L-seryl-tRNA(Ser) seleniumtransferase
MAIKPPDILNRIPSVAELLEKPPVRALAERWNRSVVAGGVRSFLEEVRTDLQRRAAELPSIRELAERAAGYIVSRQHHSLGAAINATGRLWGSPWISAPLPEAALEHCVALGRQFAIEPSAADGAMSGTVDSVLCRLTGAQAATCVHSYAGAVWLALAALAQGREVLVARAEVGDVGDADSLPRLASSAGAVLHEVGTTNRSAASDYETAVSPRAAAILKFNSDSYRVVGETTVAELDALVALARDRELLTIAALGGAPLIDPPSGVTWPRSSAQAAIADGVDLALLRGDGLTGGPSCGILLGNREVIERVMQQPLFAALRLDSLRSAALLATAECYDNSPPHGDVVPAWQCVTVSVENLRNRAERMAAQLSHAIGIASAVAVETQSQLSPALPNNWPSYGVALTAQDSDIHALDRRLRRTPVPIIGRLENNQIVLDLRTVLPRQDKVLVDGLLGTPIATSDDPGAMPGASVRTDAGGTS